MDPIPEVRSVAARALGSLIRGMGEDNFPDLVPWLLDTLKSDGNNVERSGAAQGLSEVIMINLIFQLFAFLFRCFLQDLFWILVIFLVLAMFVTKYKPSNGSMCFPLSKEPLELNLLT